LVCFWTGAYAAIRQIAARSWLVCISSTLRDETQKAPDRIAAGEEDVRVSQKESCSLSADQKAASEDVATPAKRLVEVADASRAVADQLVESVATSTASRVLDDVPKAALIDPRAAASTTYGMMAEREGRTTL
jgi:hypothetical protein